MITYTGFAIAAYALLWVAMKELQRASWSDERKREFEQARQAVTASESLPFDFVERAPSALSLTSRSARRRLRTAVSSP
jgi:hypothetical protein